MYLRTRDTKGKEEPRAHPIDGTLGDIEVLGGGSRDGGEGQPLEGKGMD